MYTLSIRENKEYNNITSSIDCLKLSIYHTREKQQKNHYKYNTTIKDKKTYIQQNSKF